MTSTEWASAQQAAMLAPASSSNLTANGLAAFDEQAQEVLKALKDNNIFLAWLVLLASSLTLAWVIGSRIAVSARGG